MKKIFYKFYSPDKLDFSWPINNKYAQAGNNLNRR